MTTDEQLAALVRRVADLERQLEQLKADLDTQRVYHNALRGRIDHTEVRGGGSPFRVGSGHWR